MKFSIRYKILLSFALIVALAVITQTVGFRITEQFITGQTDEIFQEQAQNAADQIQNFTSTIELDHLGIGKAYQESKNTDQARVLDVIQYTLRQNAFFQKISILSPTGRELTKVDKFGATPTQDLYFEIPTDAFKAAQGGATGISKVFFSDTDTVPHMNIFTPILTDRGAVDVIIKGELRLDRLWDVIAQFKIGKSGFAYVVDDEGRLIAHPDLPLVLSAPNLSSRPIIAALLKDQPTENHTSYRNEKNVLVSTNGVKIPELGWAVIIEEPQSEALSELTVLRSLFFSTLIGSVLLLVIISVLVSENLTHPIQKLIYFTNRIKLGYFNTEVSITSGDEIEELGSSLNVMNAQLRQTVYQLKEKIDLLETQKKRLDISAKMLLRRDLEVREVNDQLEGEKETISAERNKLSVILSGIHDAVIAIDLNAQVTLFNAAAESLTGYRSSEVMGKPIHDIIKLYSELEQIPPGVFAPLRTDTFEGIVFERRDVRLIGSLGKESFVNVATGKIRESSHSNLSCILTFHDVTSERKLEEMKVDFVSMAAHELRTPLTIIRGYAQTLEEEVAPTLKPDQQEYINRVVISAKNLGDLIDNLLNASRIEQGRFKVELSLINIEELAVETLTALSSAAASKRQTLTTHMQPGIPLARADRVRIGQVLSNLIANAITYTPEGGAITVSAEKVTVPEKTPADFVKVSVKDTGPGIPSDALPKLFTKFFRVSGVLEQGSKGTGLGLFISKSIIALHGGDIWAESELGKGSTFTFTLPLVMNENQGQETSSLSPSPKHGIILNQERYEKT